MTDPIKLALPKGRMYDGVRDLLAATGIRLSLGPRGYRPRSSLEGVFIKLLKPQDIVAMLDEGVRDAGFAGADWVAEREADVVELLDTGLDPVSVVLATPPDTPLVDGMRIATEYPVLATRWAERQGIDARVLRCYGATEVFPPEDADAIVDNSATGSTLEANRLVVRDVVMKSSTRLYASRAAMEGPKRETLETLAMLVRSVVQARGRVVLEVNVAAEDLETVARALPCMREPTVSQLHHGGGIAVKAAVPRTELPRLVPELKRLGGTDILVTPIGQIVP